MIRHSGYAKDIARNALLAEIERLRPLLPDTAATRRNLAAIEKARPVESMDDVTLASFVDLLSRSATRA